MFDNTLAVILAGSEGWSIFSPELGEYITPVRAQMRQGNKYYQDTADARHQNNCLIERSGAELRLILSADHIPGYTFEGT